MLQGRQFLCQPCGLIVRGLFRAGGPIQELPGPSGPGSHYHRDQSPEGRQPDVSARWAWQLQFGTDRV